MAYPPAEMEKWPEKHQNCARKYGYKSWELWIAETEAERGELICGSMAGVKAGEPHPCKAKPMGNGRCRRHGGKTPGGPASKNWQHGKYSRLFPTLPDRLQDAANRAYNDPDYLATRKEIALLEAREEELLGRLTTGESGASWQEVGDLVVHLGQCLEDPEKASEAPSILSALREVAQKGLSDIALWREVQEVMESKRRMKDTERKRLEAMQVMMEARAVEAIIRRLLSIVTQHLKDVEVLDKILKEAEAEFVAAPKKARLLRRPGNVDS